MVLGSLEQILETGTNRPKPPLWLRRHTGFPSQIERAANAIRMVVEELGLVRPSDTVVDIGCGFGVMANELGPLLGPQGNYLGVDLHGPLVRWAQRHIAIHDRRFRFILAHDSEGRGRLPISDGGADFVLAKSLFTHLTETPARLLLKEIARVLKPGRTALLTAFIYEAAHRPVVAFPYPDPRSPVRWRVRSRPQAAVAFEQEFFAGLVTDAGLTVQVFRPGFWPGSNKLNAQDVLLLGHQGSSSTNGIAKDR